MLRIASLLLVLSPIALAAQGTIAGFVRDTDSRPVADADVLVRPGDRRAKTDSSGRFTVTDLGADNYTVRARKVGYRPDSWDVKLTKTSRVEVKLELTPVPKFLDTLKVSAERGCPMSSSIEAFLCRRQRPGGLYLDYTDIDDKDTYYVGELFKDIPGIRVDFRINLTGPVYSIHTQRMSGCITSLVDGRPVTGANPIPEFSARLIALEVYVRPDSVPQELQRYTWPQGDVARTGRCTVIVYWTNRLPLEVHKG
jgi:hypothetical protein